MRSQIEALPSLAVASLIGLLVGSAAAQESRCGTPGRNPGHVPADNPTDCGYSSTNPAARYAPTFLYRIPVVFHVLQTSTGLGFISEQQIQSQIDIANEDFRAIAGTPGRNGFDTMIEFFLATEDPAGNPTNGITYSTNTQWYRDQGKYWETLAWDTTRYLNVYTNNASRFLGYVPDFPQSGGLVGTKPDRMVLLWTTVGRDAPIGPPYDLGHTMAHEAGHYLGLWHTFQGGCVFDDCNRTGDLICDTNPESQPHFDCIQFTSCGVPDPIDNYMSFRDDACMMTFTSEQTRRMRCTLENWRPDLGSRCAMAAVAFRTAGNNVASYSASRPILGDTFTGTVDLTTTGHDQAIVFGYHRADTLSVGLGYVALFDVSSSPSGFFPATPVNGPMAQFSFQIPNDSSLCGLRVFTQAAHFGGAPQFALSNAQDLTFGIN